MIRDQCVILMNLAHNPDGHERFVTWVNALGSGNPDPWAIEQQREQPWGIGGRTNHYQVDLNRDALAMSQVESRQIAQAFRRWRPQVFVDHHGQTASYFFAPPANPVNSQLSSREVEKWTEIFGRANAAAFDRYGWNYYVRDVFDLYYPGYWDSWPSLNGAVGMTYETDGGGNLAIRRDDETIVTLLDGIRRHFTASLATAAAAAANRESRLRDYTHFAQSSTDAGRAGGVRAYAFECGDDPLRAAALAENLMNAGVEVQWVEKGFRSAGAQPLWWDAPAPAAPAAPAAASKDAKAKPAAKSEPVPRGGMAAYPEAAWAAHEFAGRTFVVDLAQPAGRLARTLIERSAPVDSAFGRTQLDKYARNLLRGDNAPKESYDFYDITAWSLPVAYGVHAYALHDAPAGAVKLRVADPNADDPATEVLPDSAAIGVPLTARASRVGPLRLHTAGGGDLDFGGRVIGGRASTAYVWSCAQDGAARLTLRLLQEGFKIATATRPLRAGGRDYPRGTFIARVERNSDALHDRVEALAAGSGVAVYAVNSAYADRGDTGVGSEAIVSLKRPRIGVLLDRPVSNTSYGWLWFLFERRLGVRFTGIRTRELSSIELDRYNVLIVPDGSGGGLAGALGGGGIERLKSWISAGGVLVCLDDASEFPTLKSVGLTSAKVVGVPTKDKDKDKDKDDAGPDTLSEADRRPQYLPGTIFMASLDPRHFLCYGYEESRLPVMIQGTTFLKKSRDGVSPVTFARKPLALSGWLWPETERRLQGTAFAIDEPTGGGHVIMMTGSPAFRLFWRSTERMLLNAVIYGTSN
jgi:hypothetical protein